MLLKNQNLAPPILIERPRVQFLLQEAMAQPFISVVSGPGTGKTTAVSIFAETSGLPVIWVTATKLCNLPHHFWEKFLGALRGSHPALHAHLSDIPFRPTLSFVENFLFAWHQHTGEDVQTLLILDDYQHIEEPLINRFLQHLLDARLDTLRIILISERSTDWNLSGSLRTDALRWIRAKELEFTEAELAALLDEADILYNQNQLQRMKRMTGGWAFAVMQYMQQLLSRPEGTYLDAIFDPSACYDLLQSKWYDKYDEATKRTLVRLAVLPAFSNDLIKKFSEANLVDIIRTIRANPFIEFDPVKRLFHFQVLYKQMLVYLTAYIPDERLLALYRRAGDWFMKNGHTFEAVECFGKSHQHEKLLFALNQYAAPQIDQKLARYVLRYIDEFPPEFLAQHEIIHILVANLKVGLGKMDEAKAILRTYIEKHGNDPADEDARQVVGEAYLTLGEIKLLETKDGVANDMEMASKLLPGNSVFRSDDRFFTVNESVISLRHCHPGDLTMMVQQHYQLIQYEDKLYGRYIKGFPALYACEAAIITYDLREARRLAFEALQTGAEYERHDIVCNAHFCLLRCTIHHGNYQELNGIVMNAYEYVEQRKLLAERNTCDYMRTWLCLLAGDTQRISDRVRDPYAFSMMPEKTLTTREMIIHIMYCLDQKRYIESGNMIETALYHTKSKHLWASLIILHILSALCHMHLKNQAEMFQSFQNAYDMAYAGGIITPFIEYGSEMRTLINNIRRKEDHGFDEEWLSLIYTKANSFAKRINAIRQQFEKTQRGRSIAISLSPREQEVLALMGAGLTREDISQQLGISVHGVKRHITSLYNKLGAANRSDAIRLASTMGLVK